MDDSAKAIAVELARELDSELGGGVLAAMQEGGNTRAFGFNEAAALAGLILSAVQIAMQYVSDKKIAKLEDYLEANLAKPHKVSPAKRSRIVHKVLERFECSE